MNDPAVEQMLTELGVTEFAYVDSLDLDRIDQRASMRNQARLEAINPDVVERYVDDMRAGAVFPPIVVRSKGDRFVVLGGNHRQTAARKAHADLSAYVIACTDEAALLVSLEDNRRHGMPTTEAERVQQAQHLVALGHPVAAAARRVGITANRLQRAMLVDQFAVRAKAAGLVVPANALPDTSKSRLMNLRSDPVFVDAVELVIDAALTSEDVYRIVTDLNACRSEAEAAELVRNERVMATDRINRRRGGGQVKESARGQLLRQLVALGQINPAAVKLSTLPDQRRDMFARLRTAMDHLAAIDTELRR